MGVSGKSSERVDWVDYAKGFCIILVVMMHSTMGVQDDVGAEGWLYPVIEWARPFRIPAFFLISGLFLSRTIDRDWRVYLDRKVLHFAYFYVLWLTIEFAFKGPFMAADHGWSGVGLHYLWSLVIEPFGPLWFIYVLPIFYVVTKLLRHARPALVLLAGAMLTAVETEWATLEHFADCFVFFYIGYIAAPYVFRLAHDAQAHPGPVLGVLLAWAVAHGWLVFAGYSAIPGLGLVLALAGAAALVAASALMARRDLFSPVRYCGEHSIIIYLAFFIPMATTRIVLLKTGLIQDVGTLSLVVTSVAVAGPLVLYWVVRRTPFRFLFERPKAFYLKDKRISARFTPRSA